ALAQAGELLASGPVDAPAAGAVLAGDVADPGVDAEAAQGAGNRLGHLREAALGPLVEPSLPRRPREGQRALVEDGGAAARHTLDRLVSVLTGYLERLRIAGREPVYAAEGEHRLGA